MEEPRPVRKSNRLMRWDYGTNAVYFITVCTHNKEKLLGRICRGGAVLRPLGKIVAEQIELLPQRYPVQIESYVVMPNHIHLLMRLNPEQMPSQALRAEQSPAPTVPGILCALKSITTRLGNAQDGTPGRKIWQRSYYDHIIRGQEDYNQIWDHVEQNPLRWDKDRFYNDI